MHVLKLVFEHDIPLDRLDQSPDERRLASRDMTLEDFMRPVPVFSHFYLSSTHLEPIETLFGLSTHPQMDEILESVGISLGRPAWITTLAETPRLQDAVKLLQIGEAAIAPMEGNEGARSGVTPSNHSGDLEMVSALHDLIRDKTIVAFKEKAHHGWDLHLYSLTNVYPALFGALKPFISSNCRLFSMNGKRIRSERLFYFETWTLDKPPHGAEEVLENTTL